MDMEELNKELLQAKIKEVQSRKRMEYSKEVIKLLEEAIKSQKIIVRG